MLNGNRIISGSPEQGELLPTYPSDLIPEDHPARVLNEIVDILDLSALYLKYSREGGKTYHPKTLIKIIFYAYSTGNRQSRKISKACRENLVYMLLSGGVFPDFRTISDFRNNHFDILEDIFQQIVKLCHQLGMISFGNISFDGTKIKANASNRRIAHKDKLEEAMEKIDKEIVKILKEAEELDAEDDARYGASNSGDELPEKIKNSKDRKKEIQSLLDEMKQQERGTLSLTDKDSRFMRNKGRIQLSYNGQCATENQVIMAYDINNQEGDRDQLVTMVDKVEAIAATILKKDEYPLENSKCLFDAGYDSGKNLSYLINRKIDAYVANQKESAYEKDKNGADRTRLFTKDKFTYHTDDDYYECPMGEKLFPVEKRKEAIKTYVRHHIRYKCQSCHRCIHQTDCVKSKSGFRSVTRYLEYNPIREIIDKKLATKEGKEIYKQRAMDVEPVFGQIKTTVLCQGSLLVRGNNKVKGEFGLICIVHNIKKIINYLKKNKNGQVSFSLNQISPQFV